MHKGLMSFLDKMKSQYGFSKSAEEYNKAVAILKGKIEDAFKEGKTCCAYFNTPEIIAAIKGDPEFDGFIFKKSGLAPSKDNYEGVLICWN